MFPSLEESCDECRTGDGLASVSLQVDDLAGLVPDTLRHMVASLGIGSGANLEVHLDVACE